MPEQENKIRAALGIFAHVDAGKTTLSEAVLYESGVSRKLGRVDHGDAYLDTHGLEKSRGITIFSKTALFSTAHREFTLVDTPGHVDFAPEAERVLPVLDAAVLVISGTDGIQAHTVTLWKLLQQANLPVFLYINKMDLPGADREKLLKQLQSRFSSGCIDFTEETAAENCAMCDEAALETFLETGTLETETVKRLIKERKVFPCCFGSALKLMGVDDLLSVLDTYTQPKAAEESFGAQVFKITRDPQGNRLTWLRVTGGSLKVRSLLSYKDRQGKELEEKCVQLRLYSGEKFTPVEEAAPGQIVAVTGLSGTYAGMGLGAKAQAAPPTLEPVMTYRIVLPQGTDAATALPKLRILEEEDPQLHLSVSGESIHVQLMGKVQAGIFTALVSQRFSMEISLADGRFLYLETIENTVEGVGHFEPLRHYAEVHLLLEPLSRGSGLVFDTKCPLDVLDAPYQALVLTHLGEKVHKGVLTGSPITDMKITLLVGRAHLKHTEGGDFRQATYRALRQGLMEAKSTLLEPWYAFTLTLPTEQIGRGITDIRAMGGSFDAPETLGEFSLLRGQVPASELGDYAQTLAAYTQGRGQLQIALSGYAPCHNAEKVIADAAYDPEADLENTPDSVFCAHGAGFNVKWHQVKEYMHLESGIKKQKAPEVISRNLRMDDKELEAIMEREFGPVKRPLYRAPENRPATDKITIRPLKQQCLIIDGYNIIFAWEELAEIAKSDLGKARDALVSRLMSYNGFKGHYMVVVFDGYKVKGNPGERELKNNIHVVYTKENETGDAYIEAFVAKIGNNYNVRVATSDGLVQLSSLRSGVLRMSARELKLEIEEAEKEMKKHF